MTMPCMSTRRASTTSAWQSARGNVTQRPDPGTPSEVTHHIMNYINWLLI
jgi:hypothetical protein